MLRLFPSRTITPDPADALWHYAGGYMPLYLSDDTDEVGWVKTPHRGVQFLDKVDFPRKEKRYIFSPKFEIKYDRAFEQTLQGCRDAPRTRATWITPDVYQMYLNLHRLGFAHSYEAWQDGALAGGAIGVHVGGYISVETMFHTVSNASKAAYGQTLVRLQERGFRWIDTNSVAGHHVNYGEEWVPQWKFEKMVRDAMQQRRSLSDDAPSPALPRALQFSLRVSRAARAVGRRLKLRAASV